MAKVMKTMAQIEQARMENKHKVFNVEAAILAIRQTPMKSTGSRGVGEFKSNILEIFKSAKSELSLNQVQAAYKAGFGEDVPAKKFADACWIMSDKNSKNKNPVLKSGANKGCYALA